MFEKLHFNTARLTIRPLQQSDLHGVYESRRNPGTSKYIGDPATLADAQARIDRASAPWQAKEQERLLLAIIRREDNVLVGELMYKFLCHNAKTAEIGYRLNEKYIGQGYAFEAANGLIETAFTQFGLNKICAFCAVENQASWRLMQKLGMQQEAHLRQHFKFSHGYCDGYMYGLLRSEYKMAATA
ncbi:GNAT family N-acetyltransferase [Pseudoalteromonas rubra]|uniref:GNAT family N-acetyltransferase n=1 Tax=Pseudoalteromonas rubra TaxID=43658 RepID=A0A5S3WLJ2_9GAMM|nr:GNAT family N-acetyltransferase [Pseudoalteromonas rubra]TMP28411.1 GNAT family N-acetyltransferase [Pseudoalteromonas rubra]TMP37186.1 GNAT family N-acetyltransferase [Pseudoalteromonas rubra]